MHWRTPLASILAGSIAAAAACSDAATLTPRDQEPDEASGGKVGVGGALGSGGRKPSPSAGGGGKVGAGGIIGAGGGPAPWGTGGFGAGGIVIGVGGTPPTGGATNCPGTEPLSTHCATYPELCAPLPAQAGLCYRAFALNWLSSVRSGCGYVRLDYAPESGSQFGATYEISTGRIVELMSWTAESGCATHSGVTPFCSMWTQTSCDGVFVRDAGVPPPPPPVDAGGD
jgi:hypothetical protein